MYLTWALLLAMIGGMQAQNYTQAIGLRLGGSNGITYKRMLSEASAIEGIAHLYTNTLGFTLLYELHFYPFETNYIALYLGAGGHAGFL